MPGITIRSAEPGDIAAVRSLLVRTWHDTYDALFGAERVTAITDAWHSEENLGRAIGRPDHRFLVGVTESGRMIGTVSSSLQGSGRLVLDRLYIDPEVQRIGLGTALLAAALADWPDLRRVDLEVEPRNLPAMRFYRRHGFVPYDTGTCGGHADSIGMRRHVPPRGYSVRRAEAADVPAIQATVERAMRETNARDYDASTIAFLIADMPPEKVAAQQAQWDMWVVTDPEGGVCGTASFDGATVRKVFVSPDHQRRGLGHVLMDAVEGAAFDAGLAVLPVRSSVTALGFYEGRGYVAGESIRFGPADMVRMERRLRPAGG